MRLITYAHPATGNTPRAGVLQGDRLLDVNGLTEGKVSSDMVRILDRWEESQPVIATAAEIFAREFDDVPSVPTNIAIPVWEATLGPPLPQPRSFAISTPSKSMSPPGLPVEIARYHKPGTKRRCSISGITGVSWDRIN